MKRVTIFGKSGCGFCQRAKQLCELKAFEYRYIDIIEEGISQADLEKTVGKKVETVPQIFIGQDYIGGFTEFDTFVAER
ncbi:GrxA family glutaredoxin [Alkalimarinus alittae]|uniref:GrxA family glutaredoxin n=1 Tax=Alkalimarinus alittae TaxID=2961619 RepID=A0ABY6N0E4_9ALTE|nr:GrxA family glutaredoxin [Alkalimarinus alittae]UZE95464.1 GrxA family glutaredoxin [Alkalimarinus alittae]